jgi:ArsR family transcriptional regulator
MKTLSDETLEQVAVFLKCLGEPTRLRILRAIHDEEKTVSQLMEEIKAGQSNISKHLATLTWAHIVIARREGTSTYYRLADSNTTLICDTVCRSIADRILLSKSTLKNIQKGVST